MKRSLKDIADKNTPVFTDEAMEQFQKKNEMNFNSRTEEGTIFEVICRNKENLEKITIDGKSISKFIADM